jgi:hypothetical protein
MIILMMIIIENHIYSHHKWSKEKPQPVATADRGPLARSG